ncbi:hypothetical protein DSCO28_53260 [Desulfosarcina ovata subsp. sediminis]|uniref:Uncharacterized protein n=1 Tax=Desulfosarcina ovata subsp. sediminis TaxID=885957 RepID=A0A5K7ZXB8_9BACT|nr:hypothetical protein DSCO28_53260 [Desulfosarcina ovata subsp. sediminis]
MAGSTAGKRLWRTVLPIGVVALAVLAVLLMAGYLYLPTLVSDFLPGDQIRRLGFTHFNARISSIGPYRTTAGPFVFGPAEQPALSIGAITLAYTPGELRHKKIRRIVVSDVVVNARLAPDGIVFPGFDMAALTNDRTTALPPTGDAAAIPEITLEKLEIQSGRINLDLGDAQVRIPFALDLFPHGTGLTAADLSLRLFPRDQPLAVSARVDLTGHTADVTFEGQNLFLDAFADLVHRIPGLDLTGRVSVNAKTTVGWAPLAIRGVQTKMVWHSGQLAYGNILFVPTGDDAAVISAESADAATWQMGAAGLLLRQPVPMALSAVTARLAFDDDRRVVTGDARLAALPFTVAGALPVSMADRLPLNLDFEMVQPVTGGWTARLTSENTVKTGGSGPVRLTVGPVSVAADPPVFDLTAGGDADQAEARWSLNLKSIRVSAHKNRIRLPSLSGRGSLQFLPGGASAIQKAEAAFQLPELILDGAGISGRLARLELSARSVPSDSAGLHMAARLHIGDGRFDHPASGLHMKGIRLELPLNRAAGTRVKAGTFSITRILQHQRTLGALKGRILPKADAFAVAADLSSDLLPGLAATLHSTVRTVGEGAGDIDLTVNLPVYPLPADTDLGRFLPAAAGVTVSGGVSARATTSIKGGQLTGMLDLALADGGLRMEEKKIAVSGIQAALNFPDLPRIRSAPAQTIRFARASMGAIVVDGGSFDVHVESAKTFFVEKGRFSWCDGKVDTGSLRITAGRQDYVASLYCQRLALSRILEQLGAVNAKGTGTLNGRIPIAYRNGKIRFDDGFLFSTPGEGGQIQLTGTDLLTRGIPAGTPQFAQVELAREALKDYAYNWAKLGLVSEGEDFVMRLQFDGKPAHPLPFVYKKEIGSFVRVEAGGQGSVFQGIGLDVNLRLPLNQLLQYKDIVNMIQ